MTKRGKIEVESTPHGTFVVRARYGYAPAQRPLGSLRPGTEFTYGEDEVHEPRHWRLRALMEEGAEARDEATRVVKYLLLSTMVTVSDVLDRDPNDSLGTLWSRAELPEFAYEDLDDLIRALAEYRNLKEGS